MDWVDLYPEAALQNNHLEREASAFRRMSIKDDIQLGLKVGLSIDDSEAFNCFAFALRNEDFEL